MVKVEENVKYLVFDIETIVDGELVKKVNYPDESLSAKEARDRYAAERKASHGTDFIPITYHIPVSIAVAKISAADGKTFSSRTKWCKWNRKFARNY